MYFYTHTRTRVPQFYSIPPPRTTPPPLLNSIRSLNLPASCVQVRQEAKSHLRITHRRLLIIPRVVHIPKTYHTVAHSTYTNGMFYHIETAHIWARIIFIHCILYSTVYIYFMYCIRIIYILCLRGAGGAYMTRVFLHLRCGGPNYAPALKQGELCHELMPIYSVLYRREFDIQCGYMLYIGFTKSQACCTWELTCLSKNKCV